MEVSSSSLQHLGDSFSHGWAPHRPSLAVNTGSYFGSSRSLDMDDADLFSMRWTTTTTPSDFDFALLPLPGSPTQLASASRIFQRGQLLPSNPGAGGATQEHADLVGVVLGTPTPWTSPSSSPLLRSAQSAPVSPSRHGTMCGGRRSVCVSTSSSGWKEVVLRHVRFLMPLYRKVRALAATPRHKHARVAPAAASPGRGSTASVDEWCHGSADTAVHDAILYCKKSSGQDVLP